MKCTQYKFLTKPEIFYSQWFRKRWSFSKSFGSVLILRLLSCSYNFSTSLFLSEFEEKLSSPRQCLLSIITELMLTLLIGPRCQARSCLCETKDRPVNKYFLSRGYATDGQQGLARARDRAEGNSITAILSQDYESLSFVPSPSRQPVRHSHSIWPQAPNNYSQNDLPSSQSPPE